MMIKVYIESADREIEMTIAEYELDIIENDFTDGAWSLWKFRVVGRGVDTVFHEYGSAIADHCPDAQTKTGGYEPENRGSVKLTGHDCYDALRSWFDDLSSGKQLELAREILDGSLEGSGAHETVSKQLGWIEARFCFENREKDTAS
tara:strand:+ start:314 stop:754 length:441 start_codon:yes stop_codon:yes gene_type:complete